MSKNYYSEIDLCLLRKFKGIPKNFLWLKKYFREDSKSKKILLFFFQFEPLLKEGVAISHKFFLNYTGITCDWMQFLNTIKKIKKLIDYSEYLSSQLNLDLLQQLKNGRLSIAKIEKII
jgi:hypothetical protein